MCMGEISTTADVDIPKIARQVVIDIGYDRAKYGFDGHTCSVLTTIDEQSADIAMGVNEAYEYREENKRGRRTLKRRRRSGYHVWFCLR